MTQVSMPSEVAEPPRAPVALRPGFIRSLLVQPLTVVAVVFLVIVVLVAVLAPLLAPYAPTAQDLNAALQGPSGAHLLGTGPLGLDELSRLMFGGRTTLFSVLVAVVVYLVIGTPLGIVAGYRGGWLDWVVIKTADVAFAVPSIIVILAVVAVFPGNETAAMIAFGVLGAPALARVVRSATLGIRKELYVRAAVAVGLRDSVIIRRHVLPRVVGVIVVQASIFAATAVLMETGLGFLGVGSNGESWGRLVAEASQNIGISPWLLIPSGGIITLFVLSLTTLSDGIRDALAASQGSGARRRVRTTPPVAGGSSVPDSRRLPADPDALLSVRGLTVTLPVHGQPTTVVQRVDFDLRPGEALGIVGESGCGKSITASALFGMLPNGGEISAGSVTFLGDELVGATPSALRKLRAARVGWISQDPISSLDPSFTAGSQVADVVRLQIGCDRRTARKKALELFELVRLNDPERVYRSYPHQLSGGMAQRVGIAAAIASRPDVLIADEPTTALDVTVQAEILDILRDLQKLGTAIVLITHNWGILADLCERAVVMYAGEVVEAGSIREIVRDPQHPYTRALQSSSPKAGTRGLPLRALEGAVPPPQLWPQGCHFQDRCPLVTDECRRAPIPLVRLSQDDRVARCIHLDEHLTGASRDGRL